MRYVAQRSLTPDGLLPSIISANNYGLNDLSRVFKNTFGNNRVSTFIGEQFENYRVLGMKYHIKWCIYDVGGAPIAPTYLVFHPWWDDSGSSSAITSYADIGYLRQFEFTKYSYSRNFQQGGGWTTMKGYVPIAKFRGSNVVKTDADYMGQVGAVGNYIEPTTKANWSFALHRADTGNTALSTSNRLVVIITTEYYVKWTNPSLVGTG